MADSRKTPNEAAQYERPMAESPIGESVAPAADLDIPDAPARPVARGRDWRRLRTDLPAVLATWLIALIAAYVFAMRAPDPGLPAPLAWAATPISANAFQACRAADAAPPAPQDAPAKASGLFVRSALAREMPPRAANEPPKQEQVPQPAQEPSKQPVQEPSKQPVQQPVQEPAQQQVQEPVQQQIQEPVQQQGPPDSGSTGSGSAGGGFSGPFDISPATGCAEAGFGDLIDVALSADGARAWTINRYGLLYHSADGGRTWQRQSLPDLPEGATLSAIAADDAGRNLALAVRLGDNIGFDFYRSADGGAGWRRAAEMTLRPDKMVPAILEIPGLLIGTSSSGVAHVVALLAGGETGTPPAVWRDDSPGWRIGYEQFDAEMVHRLRMHDFGADLIDIGATGPATLPISSWGRWSGDLRFSLLERDPMYPEGVIADNPAETVEYAIDADALRALAASDDGRRVFGAEAQAILRGDSASESWSRIDLAPLGATSDFSLFSIDVAAGDRTIMAVGRNALFVSADGGATFFQPALDRYPAPWFYAVLLSGPLLAFWRLRPRPGEPEIVDADETRALSDRALGLKDPDALNLRAYAEGLSGLLRNAETKPPLVIGVTGPWGSGKSSVMQMLSELLTAQQMPVVWFNAWHHQSEEHLLASLLSNIRRQGIPGAFTRPGLRLRWRLTLQKLRPHEPIGGFLTSWLLLLLGAALLSGSLALWLAPPVSVPAAVAAARAGNVEATERADRSEKTTIVDGVETVERSEKVEKTERRVGAAGAPKEPGGEVGQAVATIQDVVCDAADKPCRDFIASTAGLLVSMKLGAVLTLLLGLVPLSRLKQVALVGRSFDPGKLMASVLPATRNPRLDEQLSFRHRFGEELRATINALTPYRLVIFIDDLDRCRPENVAAVLEAVNFVVSAADCYVVLGMDRAYVLRAIRQEFARFIEMERAERADPSLGSPEEDKGRPRDFAEHYLEKLVNLIVAVPKMTPEARGKLMETLASKPPRQEDAPRFDWLRWSRRSAAAAAILAALLGPALYVSSMSRTTQDAPAESAPVASAASPAAPPSEGGAVRTVSPDIAEVTGARSEAAALAGSLAPAALIAVAILALAGIAWAALRAVSVPPNLLVRDSQAFRATLGRVEGRLGGFLTTPRRAKRFVNRLRLFGAMLRADQPAAGVDAAELDRATVEAGALHALARELVLGPATGAPPDDPAQRAAWERGRQQAEQAQRDCRAALAQLYRSVDAGRRRLIDALFWRMWEISDGAVEGDPAVAQVAESVRAAVSPPLDGPILAPDTAAVA